MEHFRYSGVPSAAQFRKDSSVTFAVRSNDVVLNHVDWLLEQYPTHLRDASMRRVILVDLFLTANHWIKLFHERSPQVHKDRYPAVLALFESAVVDLARLLGCTRGQVAAFIEEMYGRDITAGGRQTDLVKNAKYFDKLQREEFRIRFQGGRAHQYARDAEPVRLVAVNSADHYAHVRRGNLGDASPGWAPFVMTLERAFYMTKHTLNVPNEPNLFHSSYLGPDTPIACAGTMLIEQGVIRGIRPDSGHYKPLAHNVVGALQALSMFHVPIERVMVYDFTGQVSTPARSFLVKNLSWVNFLKAAEELRRTRTNWQRAQPTGTHRSAPPPQAPSGFYSGGQMDSGSISYNNTGGSSTGGIEIVYNNVTYNNII